MTRILSIEIVAIVFFACGACSAPVETKDETVKSLDDAFELDTLIIETDDGARHEFNVYLAIDYDQQRRGLMFVRGLPELTGMLFVYPGSDTRSMWMKNTYTSLDMVFARADGSVSSVIRDTEPLSLTPQSSVEPVTYVLELEAGTARRLSIGSNSRIVWQAGDIGVR